MVACRSRLIERGGFFRSHFRITVLVGYLAMTGLMGKYESN